MVVWRMALGLEQSPLTQLHQTLHDSLRLLAGQNGTFRDSRQAERVIQILFESLVPSYRRYHHDLLSHQPD